jgi:hypothetical protein
MKLLLQSEYELGTEIKGMITGYTVVPTKSDAHEQWMLLTDVHINDVEFVPEDFEGGLCGIRTTTLLQDFFSARGGAAFALGKDITLRREAFSVPLYSRVPRVITTWNPIKLDAIDNNRIRCDLGAQDNEGVDEEVD